MKPRTLLVLLSIVLFLGAFIWFYERTIPSSEERVELGRKVFRLEKGDVTAVTIDSTKGSVGLERAAPAKVEKPRLDKGAPPPASSEWRLVRPLATRADAFAVDRLLEAVASLEKSRTLESTDPKAVGLDKPRATVRLTTKKGETVLKLGAEVPPGGNLVAGVDGRKETYVVADTILTEADRNPLDWRDRQMVHGDREDIQSVTLTGAAGGPVILVRRPQGFRIEKPVSDRADRELTEGLLADLTGLMAERFVPPGKAAADLGLAVPRETVEVVFKGQPPLRIELGAPVTGAAAPEGQTTGELTYARIGDALFEARTRLGEAARRAPAAWQAVQLSAFEVYQVESVTVQDGPTALQLTRDGTDWKRGGTLISFLSVSDLLSVLTSAKATRLLTPAEAQNLHAGAGKPLLTFTLHTKEGDETLTIYPEQKEGVPARTSGRDAVLLLSADTLKQIQAKVQDVKTAKPVTPEKGKK
ncbi:MAG TPA: DUF4340 domain-containing protein [Thermoanaerobaculia bacterium]|jgi:hypothetical protein|nr:DUF4340 domain-containing protein [Thermoanaerobaculia bacterium]